LGLPARPNGQEVTISVHLELSMAPTAAAPGHARAALAAWLARERRGEAGFVEVAVLLVSELVTNAVRHGTSGDGTVLLTAQAAPQGVRIAVQDGGKNGDVRRRTDRREDDPGGFGLELVATLASAWGVERDERGTTVWLELATRSG
jgi:anti-sigma regulatory factor (Ser/Thr protein kinase)